MSEETKEQAKRKVIADKLVAKMSEAPKTIKEKRVFAATKDILAGDKPAEVERMYGVAVSDVNRLLKKTFPDETEKYKFLEDCMAANAILALGQFERKYQEMDAVGAAKAATLFAGKALDIKKAREAGFKEAPINISAIIQLQNTLNVLVKQT